MIHATGRTTGTSFAIQLLKPMDIKRQARVPYETIIQWLTIGHPRAGLLPSFDLSATKKRHSYRIRPEDWEAFLARLQTLPKERRRFSPQPLPSVASKNGRFFRY